MADRLDEYIAKTIRDGDKGSKLLAAICAPTLNNPRVDIVNSGMNGTAVLRPQVGEIIVVHSNGGDPAIPDLKKYTASMVEKLVSDSFRIGAKPLGFGNIVDASSMDLDMISAIGQSLKESADRHHLPVMNGELADLGKRVNCQANVSGTMISIIPKNHPSVIANSGRGIFEYEGVTYAIFNPKGKAIFINCDGIGTKTEFYERIMENNRQLIERALKESLDVQLPFGLEDFIAMNADDTGKLAAELQVLSGVLETKGNIPSRLMKEKLRKITSEFGVLGILQEEFVGNRIRGYNDFSMSYNISGSAVSTIDEERLRNLPKPQEGDYLVAIRGISNPRSNGITAKRKIMEKLFGPDWHETPEGKIFLEYLATPSTILYPTFNALFQRKVATSVFHNSGGAYDGKLARPLAKHGLFVDLGDRLFQPDWREVTLAAYSLSTRDSYVKWPMGTDGFVSTFAPQTAKETIRERGLEAEVVGRLEKAVEGRTGVQLKAFNGEEIYFSGRD